MAEFADSSDVILSHVQEATLNTIPTTPTFLKTRFTGESLTYDIEDTESDEIRPDAGTADLIQVGAGVTGDVSAELSYDANLQALLADCLRGSWSANVLKRGILKKSRTFERRLELGVTDSFMRFTGVRMGGVNMNIQAKQKITLTMPVMGMAHSTSTAEVAGASYTDASLAPVMAAPDLANITVGGIGATIAYTDLSFRLTHNLRMQNPLGQAYAAGIGYGKCQITGTLKAFFDANAKDLYDLAVAGAQSSLTFDVADAFGNTYTLLFPRVKFNKPRAVVPGNNQDVFAEMTWRALYDATSATDFSLTRIAASP